MLLLFSLKESMKKLNLIRVALKHKGVIPAKVEIEAARIIVSDFLSVCSEGLECFPLQKENPINMQKANAKTTNLFFIIKLFFCKINRNIVESKFFFIFANRKCGSSSAGRA